jgi:hypothetical protein
MDETNLLSLIKPWLDTNYQITMKSATLAFHKIYQELNKPLDTQIEPKFHYAKRRFSITLKCQHIYGVLNVDEIKN